MAKAWITKKLDRRQRLALVWLCVYSALILTLAVLGESKAFDTPNWVGAILIALAILPLWYAYRVFPSEFFRWMEGEKDEGSGDDEDEPDERYEGGEVKPPEK